MNIQNRRRQIAMGLLSLVLCLSIMLPLMTASAVGGPNLDEKCSLKITTQEKYDEFLEQTVPMRLYRVADVDENGGYTPVTAFAGVDLSGLRIDSTAQDFLETSDQVNQVVVDRALTDAIETDMVAGEAAFTDLDSGLYLLRSETAYSELYEYTTMPILVQLPTPTSGIGALDWMYDAEIQVKQQQQRRLADLTIVKDLESYEPLLGTVPFVFQVEVTLDGESIYSNVETMFFGAAGTQEIIVEDLPAGAVVTVTEVYSGAAYELTGEGTQTVTMTADGASVTFTNTYNGSIVPSAGVQNHYAYQEGFGWDPEQIWSNGGGENG